MEDVLDQYERPYDPQYPLVCFDEGLKQLIEETREDTRAKWGAENVMIMNTSAMAFAI